MKRFLIKLFFSTIPALLLLTFPVWAFIKSKELLSLDIVVEEMATNGKGKLVGWGYLDNDKAFKLRMSQRLKTDILALGTSRIMQFQGEWFNEDYSFYNAGGGVFRLDEMRVFLERLHYNPKILFVCLDQFFFKENWGDPRVANYNYEWKPAEIISTNLLVFFRDWMDHKIQIDSLNHTHHIGMNAVINNNGYRADGSYYYGLIYKYPEKSEDYQFKSVLSHLEDGEPRWDYCRTVNKEAKEELKNLIEYCKSHQILLVTYLPPFSPMVWQKMMSMGDDYGYMKVLSDELSPLFDQVSSKFFSFNNGGELNSSNCEFIDGFHGSNKTYLRMVLRMLEQDEDLIPYFKESAKLKQYLTVYPDVNVCK